MSLATNIVRRGAIYYFRARVPVDLVARMQRREIYLSLRTPNPKKACFEASLLTTLCLSLFSQLRVNPKMTVQTQILASYLNQEVSRHAKFLFSAADVLKDDAERIGISPMALAHSSVGAWMEDRLFESKEMYQEHRYMELGDTAAGLLDRAGTPMDRNSPEFRQFCRELCETTVEAYGQGLEIAEGTRPIAAAKPATEVPSPSIAPSSVAQIAASLSGITVEKAIQDYLRELEQPGGPKYKLLKKTERGLRLLQWFLDPKTDLSTIRKKSIKDFSGTLKQLPIDYEKFRGEKSLLDIVEWGRTSGIKPLANNTAAGIMSAVKKFFDWCEDRELITENPSRAIKMPVKNSRPYKTFEKAQLQAIFSLPLFLGCRDNRHPFVPGTFKCRNWRYWLPIVGYFTGARIREICQLHTDDVKEVDGIWFLDINEEDGKSIKTKAARRRVPIHASLRNLGFLSYVQHVRKTGSKSLWPKLPAAVKDDPAHKPGQFFATVVRAALGQDVSGKREFVFHSFRHTMKDALRESEVPKDIQEQLMGHDGGGAGAGYGAGYSLKRLNDAIQKTRMPFTLDALEPWTPEGC
jgi:integrase